MDIRIEIVGNRVIYKQDGKEAATVPVADFLTCVAEQSDSYLLPEAIPEGVSFIRRCGDAVVLVIEEKPQMRTVRWLTDDSPAPYGPKAIYRTARLAFPFVVIVVALRNGSLTGYQQCFYRTAPLQHLSDPLCYPNLYNVANGYGQACWLCLANMKKDLSTLAWEEKVREIRRHVWGAGFNQSSEVHEGMSYWQTMRRIDSRVSSLTAWEKESKKDPFFPLSVKWQPLGKTVGDVIEETLRGVARATPPTSASELAQLISLAPGRGSSRKWLFLSGIE
jgi:hypothetical protein